MSARMKAWGEEQPRARRLPKVVSLLGAAQGQLVPPLRAPYAGQDEARLRARPGRRSHKRSLCPPPDERTRRCRILGQVSVLRASP